MICHFDFCIFNFPFLMNIIGNKYIFLISSWILVFASIIAIAVWGLRLGIDFTGGSLLEVEFTKNRPAIGDVRAALNGANVGDIIIQEVGERGILMRFREVDEPTHQQILLKLAQANPVPSAKNESAVIERQFTTIGPTIGKELRTQSIIALITASVAIILYIAWAFRRVSKPVSSWKYGIAAVVALIHDVVIPAGVFAVLGHFAGIEIDALFITAMLTIMGFSVHDTIVVFDRTRENLGKIKGSEHFGTTVNRSINETLTRSLNTSLTVLLVLLAIFFFGGQTVRYFALSLIIGVSFGTYSSIFVASPLLVVWQEYGDRRKNKRRV